ncbi:MAG: hypothetical protein V4714_22425 [Bacteroidota bacterium]
MKQNIKILFTLIAIFHLSAARQAALGQSNPTSLNQMDSLGRKQGLWHKYDRAGKLMNISTYENDRLSTYQFVTIDGTPLPNVYTIVETMPAPKDGVKGLLQFLRENINLKSTKGCKEY